LADVIVFLQDFVPRSRHHDMSANFKIDSEVLDRRVADRIERDFKTMLPFVRWLNTSLGYHPADKR
jgi:hypothetical protein